MNPHRRLLLAGYAALFASGFADNTRGPILPRVVETFAVSDARASVLLGLASFAGLPGGLAAGAILGRAGPRAALRISALTVALGLALVAIAGAIGREAFALVPVAAAVLGAGLAGLGVVANGYVVLATEPHERARALAKLHVLYAAASLVVPFFIAHATGLVAWPIVIGIAALVPGVLVPISLVVPFVAPPAPAAVTSSLPEEPRSHTLVIALYATVISLFVVGEVTVSGWLTLHVERTFGDKAPGRALYLAAFFLGMGISRASSGVLLREGIVRPAIVVGALGSAVLVSLGLHVHPAFLSAEGLLVGVLFPATMSELTLELPASLHGRAIGIVTGCYSAALGLAHTLTGAVSDASSLGTALHLSPACLVVGTLLFVGHRPRRIALSERA